MKEVKIKLLSPLASVPRRATDGSAGYDITAAVRSPVFVPFGGVEVIPTGIAIELQKGYAGCIFGRSGLGIKRGVTPANGVGLIDSDYRGEICVGLTCSKKEGYTVSPGERIAQLVIIKTEAPELICEESLSETERGEGGFGSTGKI